MMTTERVYWKRAGYVQIQDRNNRMVSYGGSRDALDFRFEGEKCGDIYGEFSVGILGLSATTINDLTVWNPADAIERSRKIRVFAGYDIDALANPIFDGFILEAIPTSPPEMWLNMRCMCNLDKSGPVVNKRMIYGKIPDLFDEVAKELSLEARIDAKGIDEEGSYGFRMEGKKIDLAQRFADTFNLTVYDDNGILVATDKRPWLAKPQRSMSLSIDNGLLGVGGISVAGATLRRRLDDTAGLFTWVDLKSTLVPSASGRYNVIRKKHKGHFRGEDWYTELECIRGKVGK